ncbi:hypothetical protein PENANT_c039G00950 [Penicillium antarcticum]|uniref:Uncharacterized protein n=1 Tax=Penicillium antarcticum TaxID=416450 RepID=A0A1V6PTT9_9EURO|nr:uncharacterized protein N7508_008277 [Penicillium antarcticum]KAJ5298028.1 hypothetical protein N7508_008277 [Penicillium antarcticum]OQD80122.1 hypothetical protein PENANT_c039G00950 [Penicillium antarcticum]
MKGLLALLGLLAATTSPATAAAISFHNAALTQTNRNCDGSVIDPQLTKTFGTVELTRAGNQLVAVAVLLGGTPNKAYNVRLIQIKNGADVDCGKCDSGGGTLTTNNRGIGSTYVRQAVAPGVTAAWVDLNQKDNCDNFYTIAPLSIA